MPIASLTTDFGDSACGSRAGILDCSVPRGASLAFVSATSGADLRWRLTYWHPASVP
jgi:hypothetical protein